ncbi:MAG: hypothetical protein HY561_13195 [Gemmatimonadetes bacterium]|nr:hypothetical protein [Gemmatimonadota bacterium]
MRLGPMRRAGPVLLLTAIWACEGNDAPVGPEAGARVSASTSPDLSALAKYVDGPLDLPTDLVQQLIGPAGGSLSIGGFETVVPPGAVSIPTLFTILVSLGDERVHAEFGPHDQTFLQPVTLRTPYLGTTAEGKAVRVLWWDGASWVPLETTVTADGRLEASTTHFSEYGTEEELRGITVSGG